MSTYDWPRSGRIHETDDVAGRTAFVRRQRQELDPRGVREALHERLAAAHPPDVLAAPANQRALLWRSLGPDIVVHGQAAGEPRVSGRVRALAVHPDGERLYAASANGGVWYSSNAGGSWASLGGFAPADRPGTTRPAQRHSCGSILVQFNKDHPDDPTKDVVYVGTGEPGGKRSQPGSSLGGIGVLLSIGPSASAQTADPWIVEGANLTGASIGALAADPAGTTIVAATSVGLYERNPASDYTKVAGSPFHDSSNECTDAVWTPADGTRPAKLWVWVQYGASAGLWVRANGQTDFTKVATPGMHVGNNAQIAAARPPRTVYVLHDRYERPPATAQLPALYQVDVPATGVPTTSTLIAGVPDVLGRQGFYDLAVEVDPNNPATVLLGGSAIAGTGSAGGPLPRDAAIFSATIGPGAGAGNPPTYGGTGTPTMIGTGAHADVHALKLVKNGTRLFTGCDGGVFRSDRPTQNIGFIPCNDGLSVIESNYLAAHPTCEGFIACGLQDNGIIEHRSSGVWKLVGLGDGGGIAFDPLDRSRYMRQYHNGLWDGGGYPTMLSLRPSTPPPVLTTTQQTLLTQKGQTESDNAAFYSTPASTAHGRVSGTGVTQVGQIIVGTTRVWYTEDLGATFVTLPTAKDPITSSTYDSSQDDVGEEILVCRWFDADIAWILSTRTVRRMVRINGSDSATSPGTWTSEVIIGHQGKDKKQASDASGPIRKARVWTDLAVNPGSTFPGAKGSVYLGTNGHPDDDEVDTLWWFDGTTTWHPTGLRLAPTGVQAPVTAVLVDTDDPQTVFVGTTVGVWKGVRTPNPGHAPTWAWTPMLNGLPEASVEDLALFSDGGVRLLRAAVVARGVWEVRLDSDLTDLTYVRVHEDDLRVRPTASLARRDQLPGDRSWHGSPDIRPRTVLDPTITPPQLPWTSLLPPPSAHLRKFQAAMRSRYADGRIRVNGMWDGYFDEIARELLPPDPTLPIGAPPVSKGVLTAGIWAAVMAAPHGAAEPWGLATPTEADLYDSTPSLSEGTLLPASCNLLARPTVVDVVAHRRGLVGIDGNDVRVTLLRWSDPQSPQTATPASSLTWFSGPVPFGSAVDEVLNSGPGTTSQTFAGGWTFVGSNATTRRRTMTGQQLDDVHAGVASFDLDLTGLTGQVVLLVAVLRADGPSAVSSVPLRQLALNDPHVAVRSIRVT